MKTIVEKAVRKTDSYLTYSIGETVILTLLMVFQIFIVEKLRVTYLEQLNQTFPFTNFLKVRILKASAEIKIQERYDH